MNLKNLYELFINHNHDDNTDGYDAMTHCGGCKNNISNKKFRH